MVYSVPPKPGFSGPAPFRLFAVPGGRIIASKPFRRPPSPRTSLGMGQMLIGSRGGDRIGGMSRPAPRPKTLLPGR